MRPWCQVKLEELRHTHRGLEERAEIAEVLVSQQTKSFVAFRQAETAKVRLEFADLDRRLEALEA